MGSQLTKMVSRILLFLAATAVSANAVAVSCDVCKQGMTGIFKILQSQPVVDQEIELFKERFCDKWDDKCQLFLANWGEMQRAWLGAETTPTDFCADLNQCDTSIMRLTGSDECETCKSGVAGVASDMTNPSVRIRTVNLLKGMAYCGQVNLAGCKQLVETFVPQAMAVLAEELPNKKLDICQAYKVCQ